MKRHINLAAIRNAACAAALLISPLAARAVEYEFTNLAFMPGYTGGGVSYLYAAPAINNAGTVAYLVGDEYGGGSYYKISPGGSPTPVGNSGYLSWYPVLNNNGQIAYTEGNVAYFATDSSWPTTIHQEYSDNSSLWHVRMNDNGVAAVCRYTHDPATATIYRGTPGNLSSIGSEWDWVSVSQIDLDNSGTLAVIGSKFHAGDVSSGVFVISPDNNVHRVMEGYFSSVSIDNGHIAAMDGAQLWIGTAAGLTAITDAGEMAFDGTIDVNASGQVAFLAYDRQQAKRGIFTGGDPVNDKIVGVGEVLFGAKVDELLIGSDCLNDSGQIAFAYQNYGGTGFALATPSNLPPSLKYNKLSGQTASFSLNNADNWNQADDAAVHRVPTAADRLRFQPNMPVAMNTHLDGPLSVAAVRVDYSLVNLNQAGYDLTVTAANGFDGAITVKESARLSVTGAGGTLTADALRISGGQFWLAQGRLNTGAVEMVGAGLGADIYLADSAMAADSVTMGDAGIPGGGSTSMYLERSTMNVAGAVAVHNQSAVTLDSSSLTAQRVQFTSGGYLYTYGTATINAAIDGESYVLSENGLSSPGGVGLTINGSIAHIVDGRLTGGNWNVRNSTIDLTQAPDITANESNIYIVGAGSRFHRLGGLQENVGILNLSNGATLTINGTLNNTSRTTGYSQKYGDLTITNRVAGTTRLTITGDLNLNKNYCGVNVSRYGDTAGEALLEVGGSLNSNGSNQIRLTGGTIAAAAVNLSGGELSGHGQIISSLHNTGGTILPQYRAASDNTGVLTVTGDVSQGAGGTLKFVADAAYGFGRLNVGGQVDLGGALIADFAGQSIAQATLIQFSDPAASIHFKSIRSQGLAPEQVMIAYRQPGQYNIRVVSSSQAGQQIGTDIASADTLQNALGGYSFSADELTGSVSLYTDGEQQVLRLADEVGTPVILSSPSFTLGDQLNVALSYKFQSTGKLDVLFHDFAGGDDILLTRLVAGSYSWDENRMNYVGYSELLQLGEDGFNLSGHSGQVLFRLANQGDPEVYLSSLELVNVTGIIPEPSCLGLLAVGALGLMRRRRAA